MSSPGKNTTAPETITHDDRAQDGSGDTSPPTPKKQKLITLPVIATGAGLFSDGYINNVIGSVSTILIAQYGAEWTDSQQHKVVSAIAFAGCVVGMLAFGFLSDHWSRMNSLMVSTVLLVIFTILAAGSYYKGETVGMFTMLAVWRFFVGIGIGGEYPAGSVGCAESTGEVRSGWRHCAFIFFTNTMIDFGFVAGAFVPFLVAHIFHDQNFDAQWRTSLGIGAVFPLALLGLRFFVKEPEASQRESMRNVRTPWRLVFRFYGWRLFTVSLIWFIYDFLTYPFGIYSSTILKNVAPDAALSVVFGWNTLINVFYIPGTLLGSKASDLINPRYCLTIGALLQAAVGFAMAANYPTLSQPATVGAFAAVYGLFISLGEFGLGNNIGLLAAKTCATGIRGRYYAVAAAVGKIGAFVGTYVYPYLQAAGGEDTPASAQIPFYLSSGLCIVSALLAFFFLPNVNQDTIELEDVRFRAYLEENGWDTRQLGMKKGERLDTVEKGTGDVTVLAADGEARA